MNRGVVVGVLLGLGILAGLAAAAATAPGLKLVHSKRWRTTGPSVEIPDNAADFLDALAERCGFDLVVTSGTRTTRAQARAMIKKVKNGDSLADLLALYGDDAQIEALWPFLAVGDEEGAAAVIEEHIERGRYLSRHLATSADSWALDIDDPKDPRERAQLIATAKDLGVRVLDEGNHIHIEHRGSRNV